MTTNDAVPEPVLVAYDNELVSTFEAAARIFMSLFFGAKKLAAEKKPTPEERGAVTYSFVRMFGQVLDILRESSSSQAAQEAALTLAANSRRQMTTRGSQKLFGRTAKQDALATRLLSNFLSNILNAPLPPPAANGSETPPQHRHHQELVEGFLFVLFRHLGDRVFLCTFGHRKRASVEADIDAWVDPAATEKEEEEEGEGVPDEEDPPPLPSETDDREKQIQQRALAIELPLLVALLERGLAVARRHIAPVSSSSSSSSSSTTAGGSRKQGAAAGTRTATRTTTTTTAAFSAPRSSGSSSSSRPSAETLKAGLSLLARKKLERTLAQAIFSFPGGDGEEDGDGDGGEGEASRDEMSECLMMPVRQALVEPVAGPQRAKKKAREGGDEDVKAWFVERVWGLVGWEAVLEMR
ncbi:mitochondrial 54S ribosomal protein YmL35 [Diplodia seriata]|uniref:Mitochondrial 54S ribosomal protein YmL35 n=1 Tax=Diplodia seriata TaxID=420778 RepID=A0ABR3BZ69_9PEZI